MHDVQNEYDSRGIEIDEVGIAGLRFPVAFDDGVTKQSGIADAAVAVRLRRGTHTSRTVTRGIARSLRCSGWGTQVGGAVEPVDPQQRLLRIGFGPLAQPLDEGRVVDGDAGPGGLSGQQARGCAQQVAGVHQDDATVHAFHPLPGIRERFSGQSSMAGSAYPGFPSSLPDHARVNGRNSIIGVANRERAGKGLGRLHRPGSPRIPLRTVMIQHALFAALCESGNGPGPPGFPTEAFTMAKNKNRKQGSQHDRASESERGSEQAKSTAFESQTQPQSQSRAARRTWRASAALRSQLTRRPLRGHAREGRPAPGGTPSPSFP
ncbi:hypothetical protein SVIOM74S_09444 [Streptomyces violarus]